jgi:hypothetical protein
MKMKNAIVLALMLSLSARAADTNLPVAAAPAAAPIESAATPATNAAAEISPAPEPAAPAKPDVKKSKKTKKAVKKSAAKSESSAAKKESHVDINPPETGTVKDGVVNVRGRPSFIGEVVAKLKKGESVTLLEEINTTPKKNEPSHWYRIALPTNETVWVNSSFIDPTTKTVVPKKLNMRGGPGENFSTLGTLDKGTEVKELRSVNGWSEIEAPANAFAYVAADLIDRSPVAPTTPAPEPAPAPAPAPEVVAVPPIETNAVPASPEAPAPAQPVTPDATPAPAENPAPPVVENPPVEAAPAVEEPLPKRVVTREGIVRRSLNVQTPSYFELESIDTGKIINYLYSPQAGFTLKPWVGTRVIVTGEEVIDKRWPNTPVIEIESIDQR